MADLKTFARRIRERAQEIEVNTDKITATLATTINQSVVLATPVDTGHARANWQVGIGASPLAERDEEDQGGAETIRRNNGVIQRRKTGQTIYLVNNVEYIVDLNNGSSAQAPANFVALAISAGIRGLARKKVLD